MYIQAFDNPKNFSIVLLVIQSNLIALIKKMCLATEVKCDVHTYICMYKVWPYKSADRLIQHVMRNKYIHTIKHRSVHTYICIYIWTTMSLHVYILHTYIWQCFLFGFLPLCCFAKIMRPFLRKHIKTKSNKIAIIHMYVHRLVCMSIVCMCISVTIRQARHSLTRTRTAATLSQIVAYRLKMTLGCCVARRSVSLERVGGGVNY